MQTRNIKKLVEYDLRLIVNLEKQSLNIKSTTVGEVGKNVSLSQGSVDDARLAYFRRMILNLQLAMSHYSSDLAYSQKTTIHFFLNNAPQAIDQWIKKNKRQPPLEIYEALIIRPLQQHAWLKLRIIQD